MPNAEPNYIEFSDPRLVAIYNTVCPLDGYEKFDKVYGFWDWSLATPAPQLHNTPILVVQRATTSVSPTHYAHFKNGL